VLGLDAKRATGGGWATLIFRFSCPYYPGGHYVVKILA